MHTDRASVHNTSQGFSQTLTTRWQIWWGPPGTTTQRRPAKRYLRGVDPSEGRKLHLYIMYVIPEVCRRYYYYSEIVGAEPGLTQRCNFFLRNFGTLLGKFCNLWLHKDATDINYSSTHSTYHLGMTGQLWNPGIVTGTLRPPLRARLI